MRSSTDHLLKPYQPLQMIESNLKIISKDEHMYYYVEYMENGKRYHAFKEKRALALRHYDTLEKKLEKTCKIRNDTDHCMSWYGSDPKIVAKVNKIMKLAFGFTHKPMA